MDNFDLRKYLTEGRIHKINEGYHDIRDEVESLMKKRGYEYKYDESTNGDHFHKRFDEGVLIVEIEPETVNSNEEQKWVNIHFIPYVKIEKKYLGLIKQRLDPKGVNIKSDGFDFGVGLFDNTKEFIPQLIRDLEKAESSIESLPKEYFPPSDNQNPLKKDFWDKKNRSGSLPSKILYKNPKDYTQYPI